MNKELDPLDFVILQNSPQEKAHYELIEEINKLIERVSKLEKEIQPLKTRYA